MVTSRFRWLLVLGAVGSLAGLLRGQETLALLSLALLLWILVEWLWFRIRFVAVCRSLKVHRRLGDDTSAERQALPTTLWCQRPASIALRIEYSFPLRTPVLRVSDYLSEKWELVQQAPQRDMILSRGSAVEIAYRAQPRAAGSIEFHGARVEVFDLHGLFFAEAFVPCKQSFRVLPMPVRADGPQPHLKTGSALPPPGIHRLQKAGMGGELLDLREYVPGDPPKAIAWKVSARRDSLMIRQHESEVPIRTTLMVDCSNVTRYGSFGRRSIDQLTILAATIAQASLSVRDPVGLTLIDETSVQLVQPRGGNRHYFQLLAKLGEAAGKPAEPGGYLTRQQFQRGWLAAKQLYPGLMRRNVNRVPFFWFPLAPQARWRRTKRIQLASLLTEIYQLPTVHAARMMVDDAAFAPHLQRLLTEGGAAVTSRSSGVPEHHVAKVGQFTAAMLRAVGSGRDNEIFVLLIDLLDYSDDLGQLLRAIRVAVARHHRVIVICPWPDWLGPRRSDAVPADRSAPKLNEMLYEGERIRLTKAADSLARSLRRAGAKVAFAADPHAAQLILTQADLVRSGRAAAV